MREDLHMKILKIHIVHIIPVTHIIRELLLMQVKMNPVHMRNIEELIKYQDNHIKILILTIRIFFNAVK